jgi:hypothetical protein
MSEEERELLARIGQLAGQINRHKNGQTGPRFPPNSHPAHHRRMLRSQSQNKRIANAHKTTRIGMQARRTRLATIGLGDHPLRISIKRFI